ncbi:MAG: TIGR01459 family HAD-type hydrolase [Sulfitobacter sp.]
MNFAQAIASYEAVRERLPAVRAEGACVERPNLDALADEFDVFLLDAFGVLNIGETHIDGVPERVKRLQAAGKRVMIVSNAAGVPHAGLMQKYQRLGYDFASQDLITSRKATLHALHNAPPLKWGLMASLSAGQGDLEPFDMTYLAEDATIYDQAEAFVMLGSAEWTETRQSLLEASLRAHPRPVYVGNPDIVAPRETGFSVEPGHYAHRLANETGVEVQFFGKPFGNIYDLAFAQLGSLDRNRIVMVGDSLHTDILGGQNAGVKTALISGFGLFAGHNVDGPISASGIRPDYILNRP